jgi:hypothetical protein
MRRKQNYVTYGAVGVALFVVLIDVLRQWLERKESGEKLSWDNYDGKQTIKSAFIGATTGAALGYAYYKYKVYNEELIPFDPDEYLLKLDAIENINSHPETYDKVIAFRNNIKSRLWDLFRDQMVCKPVDTGSFRKRTANISNYDLDIILPMRRNSFSSLQEMYDYVFNALGRTFDNNVVIRKQTKAIALIFSVDGYDIYCDVVPGREIGNYLEDHELNLYVRPDWIWERGRSFKVNTHTQRSITVNQPEARKAIRLLKLYRDRNRLNLPTIIIEQCVVKAMSENVFGVYRSMTENLLNCMDYIAIKLSHTAIVDLANTNNNLNDKISDFDRGAISNRLASDINSIEKNFSFFKRNF